MIFASLCMDNKGIRMLVLCHTLSVYVFANFFPIGKIWSTHYTDTELVLKYKVNLLLLFYYYFKDFSCALCNKILYIYTSLNIPDRTGAFYNLNLILIHLTKI